MMKRSFGAAFVSAFFRLLPQPTEARAEAEIAGRLRKGEKPTPSTKQFPTRRDGRFFYANEDTGSNITVFYIHGGGYELNFSPFHWKHIRKIIKRTDALVIAPDYKLIPFGDCRDAFDMIVPFYKDYAENNPQRKIVLMGDSAGGGLALALAVHFGTMKIRMPDELILMSPWVDVTMEKPDIAQYTDKDPWLAFS